jgi:hypothetical protein
MDLKIFLSHASEDATFANAISGRLKKAFKQSVGVDSMSQFPLGMDWRNKIDAALDEVDILLVVATGREKLSHTFTGYEVGYFRKSQQTHPYIRGTANLKRVIIPIAISAEIPDTLSDIQGVEISPHDRFFFGLDSQGRVRSTKDDPIYELFLRIDGILNTLSPVEHTSDNVTQQQENYAEYKRQSALFYDELGKLMRTMPLTSDFPKTRITLRLPPECCSISDFELDQRVSIACTGPMQNIFEQSQSNHWVSWPSFYQRIGSEDIALMWSDALRSLVVSSLTGEFGGSDQLVFSFDESRLFRLFVSQSTIFFDHSREVKIYVIETLRPEDVGDPLTTLLGKAIAIALRFRSLFLESNSPYGPNLVRLSETKEVKKLIRKLMRELRVLLMQSREAKLGDKKFIIALYGTDESAIRNVQTMMRGWSEKKDALYRAAGAALAKTEGDEVCDTFVEVLEEFCAWTRSVNAEYMTRVMDKLRQTLE